MLKKFNQFITTSIVISFFFLVLGIIMVIFPEVSFQTIAYILGIGLIISGIFFMLESSEKLMFMSFLSLGVLQICLGFIIILYPSTFKTLVPILIGLFIIVKAAMDCRISIVMRACNSNNWFIVLCLAILSIACGIMIILNPHLGSLALITAIGAIIIVYSISAIIDACIVKSNVKEITKYLGINKK